MSRTQVTTILLVAFSIVIDGFDVQSMGFVAPSIIKTWSTSRADLGPVFAASLIGMMLGSIALGPLADRIGRRPVLIASTLLVSICMLASAATQTLFQLLVLRFLTGASLGGIMGNAIALVGELTPKHKRTSLMMWVSAGFTMGAAFGGVVASVLLPIAGWRGVFIFGGALPLLLSLLMLAYLQESPSFLVMKGSATHSRLRALMEKIDPDLRLSACTTYVFRRSRNGPVSPLDLLRARLARTTLLLWATNFLNLLNLFFLANWLPTIAIDLGFDAVSSTLIGTSLQVGGIIGTFAMGPLIDRQGFFRVLAPIYLIAVASIVGLAHLPAGSIGLALLSVSATGFAIVGGQPAINAMSANAYPADLRATGVSWCLGIGRAGSIAGPLIAAQLLQMRWTPQELFSLAAAPVLVSILLIYLLQPKDREE
ncbi:MFS transporter [Caballeronia sp. J97]|uniref:MFS transporter n=1 Tax=Caballeronia sp. J97 TaxID=2805429 RepID=UPI002AB31484|nr:MFS transporter [Caballeronia sp. J97]